MTIGKLAGAALAATAMLLLAARERSETSIKIDFINSLSGAFANVGAHALSAAAFSEARNWRLSRSTSRLTGRRR